MKHNILLIDDNPDLCFLLKRELKNEGYDITVCHDGEAGIMAFQEHTFQLVILDIMLPVINGFDVLSALRKKDTVPVLMLTAKDSEADKVSGLRLGADDYLTKPFLMNELIARVQSLIRRYTVFNKSDDGNVLLEYNGLTIDPSLRTVCVNGNIVHLTAREFDLLYFLASHQGKVFTKEQIYTHVWSEDYAFDDSNIMSFISKLRKKIKNDKLGMDYIQTIHGIGYRFHLEA